MASCMLVVEVVCARDLEPQGRQYGNPYVVLNFNSQRFRTATKEKDLNPVWNERFYFNVSVLSNLHELVLETIIYHDRIPGCPECLLGKVRIYWTSFVLLPDDFIMRYPLEGIGRVVRTQGELYLKAYVTDEASVRASDPLLAMDSVTCSPDFHVSDDLESRLQDQSSIPRDMPLQHLKEITNNFSDERILGHGGFGVVYKGVMHNGETIAVKKIVSSLMPGLHKQFENEVYHLMMLNHPNIVRFLGYCYKTKNVCLEYNGRYVFADMAEKLLCLEYLAKGSLDKYLSDESSGLNWSTRYKIIEGICHGLCHLREQIDKPIIHLDLKPVGP